MILLAIQLNGAMVTFISSAFRHQNDFYIKANGSNARADVQKPTCSHPELSYLNCKTGLDIDSLEQGRAVNICAPASMINRIMTHVNETSFVLPVASRKMAHKGLCTSSTTITRVGFIRWV